MNNSKLAQQKMHEQEILAIADEMAASVTKLSPHTYEIFLNSRERLQHKIHDVLTEYHNKF
jgi:hypothetical protein